MSLKAKIESDHNTLTDVVSIVGDTRGEMHHRFDQQDRDIVGLKAHIVKHDERFDRLESRFDGLESRFDGLESRFDGLESRFDKLESRFDGLESRFDKLESRFDKLESRFDSFESRFDEQSEQIKQLGLLIRRILPAG